MCQPKFRYNFQPGPSRTESNMRFAKLLYGLVCAFCPVHSWREGHENGRKKWPTEVWDCVFFDPWSSKTKTKKVAVRPEVHKQTVKSSFILRIQSYKGRLIAWSVLPILKSIPTRTARQSCGSAQSCFFKHAFARWMDDRENTWRWRVRFFISSVKLTTHREP